MVVYLPVKKQFLIEHPICQCCDKKPSKDIHHTRGRVGALLTDTRYFLAACRPCHSWIGEHPAEAREKGWLCQPGLWNVPDRS